MPGDPPTAHRRDDRAREERYSALIANSPYCIHEIDDEGRLVSMNPAGLRMMGVDAEAEVVGMAYLQSVGEADRDRIAALLDRAMDGEFSEFEFTAINGRVLHSNFVPLPVHPGATSRLMGITQDVTDRRALERQLVRDRHLDAIGRLAGGVAHDFNNLLTVIISAADSLHGRLDESSRPDAEAILNAATRASDLTSQLLAFGRKPSLREQTIELDRHLDKTERLLRRLLPENVAFDLNRAPAPIRVRIDPGQLDQLIVNLAVNARDAMPEGGRLRIDLSEVTLDTEWAGTHSLSRPGKFVRVRVADTGRGMTPDVIERAFEPFYTTKNPGVGTGLGLALCDGIVRQAGGSIEVVRSTEIGTIVEVHLPIAQTGESRPSQPALDRAAVPGAKILVVEDNEMVRQTVVRILASHDYEVAEAATGEEALEVASAREEPIELLVTDVVLPGINGQQLAKRMLTQHPSTRVLYSSGYTDDIALEGSRDGDEVDFLPKPYAPSDLLDKVAQILAR